MRACIDCNGCAASGQEVDSKDQGLQTHRVFSIGAEVRSPLLPDLAFDPRAIFEPRSP